MRVQIVDPSAFTPPYDHALCAALARAGADVELLTSRFLYGPVPREGGYSVTESFYRRTASRGLGAPARRAFKLAEHLPDMLRHRRHPGDADVVHYQWLTLPGLDRHLLSPLRPRLLTLHFPLPGGGDASGPGPLQARRIRALGRSFDALVVHSEHARDRLTGEFGVPPDVVEQIPHGALDYLTRLPQERGLPVELASVEGPVILAFGLIRPYKGTDVLLEAFRGIEGAELWIVGMPRMDMGPLHELAAKARGTVRFVERFITDPEIPAYMRRADVLALPYREVEQSGVLYSGLAFGVPMVLSSVGGFPEVAATGAARLVPPDDPAALRDALRGLLASPEERAGMTGAARDAAAGSYSWRRIADRTIALYERLLAARR